MVSRATFSIGSSSLKSNESIEVKVTSDPHDPDLKTMTCKINGVPFTGSAIPENHGRCILAVRHKASKKMLFFEDKMYDFRPHFEEKEVAEEKEKSEETNTYDKNKLIETFGSQVKQRALNERRRTNVDPNAAADVGKLQIEEYRLNSDKRRSVQANLDGTSASENHMLPPCDLETDDVSKAFDLSMLCSNRVFAALESESRELMEASKEQVQEWKMSGKYPLCVLNRLEYLPLESEARLKFAQKLVLASYMRQMQQAPYQQMRRKIPFPDMPLDLFKHLSKLFTVMAESASSKSRTLPPAMKEKILYHILVLILTLDNFTTTMDDLLVDFKMSSERMTRYFLYLGAKVTLLKSADSKLKLGKSYQVTLTAPLIFPDSTAPSARKKKRR